MECLRSSHVKLKPHQRKLAAYMLKHRGALALWETGSGKTLGAAASAACCMKRKVVQEVVVLVKKSAIAQFKSEVVRFWPSAPLDRFTFLTVHTFFKTSTRKPVPAHTFLVVDEAHEFANPDAATTQRLLKYALQCKRVLLLTATPYVNSLQDFIPLMAMVKGDAPLSKRKFDHMAADPRALRAWLRNTTSVMLTDKGAGKDFARVVFHDVPVRMAPATWREYQKRLRKHVKKPFYMDLRELTMGASPADCEKCRWIQEHVRAWMARGEGKIIVYTSFVDKGVHLLEESLRRAGAHYAIVDGSRSAAQRRAVVDMFNKPPLTKKQLAERKAKHADMARLVEGGEDGSSSTSSRKASRKTRKGGGGGGVGICGGQVWFERTAKPKKEAARLKRPLKHADYDYTYTVNGRVVRDAATRERFEEHVRPAPIPPRWTPAKVCHPNQKMLWAARDGKGRWQRRYTQLWNVQQEFKKILRLKRLTPEFWKRFRRTVEADMAGKKGGGGKGWSPRRLAATATALMAACKFRPGWRSKMGTAGHYGVSTLLGRHVKVGPGAPSARFQFVGKSGKPNACVVKKKDHPRLVANLAELARAAKPGGLLWTTQRGAPFTGMEAQLKQYLKALRIRAKDFRTYFANYTLMDMLRAHTYKGGKRADEVNLFHRRRALAQVYKAASQGLNNTPTVARDSYIFTGFTVMYLVDPVAFLREVEAMKGKPTEAVLEHFVRLFEKNKIDWRAMLEELNAHGATSRDLNVIIITDAGAESMDLRGVRHIVLADPTWTDSLRQQIIGRGQRYRAHAHLPASQRRIDVWELFLEPPPGASKAGVFSADRRVAQLASAKKKEEAVMYALLKSVDIFKS